MEFLSEEYFAALDASLSQAALESDEPTVAIGQLVTGGPDGDVAWTLHLGGGRPSRLERHSVAEADVTLVEEYETARAITDGAAIADALREGRIKVRGDANALVRNYARLAAIVPSGA